MKSYKKLAVTLLLIVALGNNAYSQYDSARIRASIEKLYTQKKEEFAKKNLKKDSESSIPTHNKSFKQLLDSDLSNGVAYEFTTTKQMDLIVTALGIGYSEIHIANLETDDYYIFDHIDYDGFVDLKRDETKLIGVTTHAFVLNPSLYFLTNELGLLEGPLKDAVINGDAPYDNIFDQYLYSILGERFSNSSCGVMSIDPGHYMVIVGYSSPVMSLVLGLDEQGLIANPSPIPDPLPGQQTLASTNQNYIKTVVPTIEMSSVTANTLTNKSIQTVQYFDGLGRPTTTVQTGISPTGRDIVSYQEYDGFGRESNSWLPVAVANNKGAYVDLAKLKANTKNHYGADANPYNKIVYEQSPLNRVNEQYGAGESWQSRNVAVKTEYLTNTTTGDLACALYKVNTRGTSLTKNGNYAAGELYVTRITDEDKNIAYEFKNKLGQVVLTRQINGGHNDTYYVYDDFGNQCFVLPPLASDDLKTNMTWPSDTKIIQDYAYIYKYDARNRCIAKKLPGVDWTYYVYDKADRLIFTQNGENRLKNEWMFSIFDKLGRIVLTGICAGADDQSIYSGCFDNRLINAEYKGSEGIYKGYDLNITVEKYPELRYEFRMENPLLLTINYYDTYEYLNKNGVPSSIDYATKGNTKGLLTGSGVAMLDNSTTMLYSAMYYDYRGNIVVAKSTNHLGGVDTESVRYNFSGQPTAKTLVHTATGKPTKTLNYTYTYDHALRLIDLSVHQEENEATTKQLNKAIDAVQAGSNTGIEYVNNSMQIGANNTTDINIVIDTIQIGVNDSTKYAIQIDTTGINRVINKAPFGVNRAIDKSQLGVNLALNTKFKKGIDHWSTWGDAGLFVKDDVLTVYVSSGHGGKIVSSPIDMVAGDEYVVSMEIRSDDATNLNYNHIMGSPWGGLNQNFTEIINDPIAEISTEWKRIVFKIKALYTQKAGIGMGMKSSNNTTFQIRELKLEVGTKATPWTPAPEDTPLGVNLALNTKFTQGLEHWRTWGDAKLLIKDDILTVNVSSGHGGKIVSSPIDMFAGDEYVVSMEVRSDDATNLNYNHIMGSHWGGLNQNFTEIINDPIAEISTEWKRIVFKIKALYTQKAGIGMGMKSSNNTSFQIREFKLEAGTEATPWTPAPIDDKIGINLALNTKFTQGLEHWRTWGNARLSAKEDVVTVNVGSGSGKIVSSPIDMLAGDEYVVSMEVRSDNATNLNYNHIMGSPWGGLNQNFTEIMNEPISEISTEWKRIVFKIKAMYTQKAGIGMGIKENYSTSFQIRKFKLEAGTKATPWTPAPGEIPEMPEEPEIPEDNKSKISLIRNTYDELGRLQTKTRNNHSDLTATYAYDIRSRLTAINESHFKENLEYTDGSNIKTMKWTQGGKERTYAFEYDALSQLETATYSASGEVYSTNYKYLKQGNINYIERNGKVDASTYDPIDKLILTYNGNQLTNVKDAVTQQPLIAESNDFKNLMGAGTSGTTQQYFYNANGAMIKDLNKGILNIKYNYLNLPTLMDVRNSFGELRKEYTYSASGTKLRVVEKKNPRYSTAPVVSTADMSTANLTSVKTLDYVGNMYYEDGILKRILFEGGYYADGDYHFYLQNHLGDNNVVADKQGKVVQSNNYYPFGLSFADGSNPGKQPYKYSNKELDSDIGLNIYDSHARLYDPQVPRFLSMDPLAEKYYSISPYVYCANNPLKYTDPTGMYLESIWDAANISMGVASFVDNIKNGKIGASIVDGLGIAVDVVALALPIIPGGAGAAIKATRAADKALDATKIVKVADKVEDAGKSVKKIDFVVTPDGTTIHKSQSRMKKDFDKAGYKSKPTTKTSEKGDIYTIDTKFGKIDVRTMEGSSKNPKRAVHSRAGTNDPVKLSGEKFKGSETKADRRNDSHLNQY